MKRPLHSLTLAATLLTQSAFAGSITADFNDNSLAPLGNLTQGAGQEGGFGWLVNDTWANTGSISVITDDLTAPAATGYSVTQSGTGQSIQGSFASSRQTTRAIDTPLTGTVWFSYLLNQPTADSRGGITFNQNTLLPSNPRIVATGTEVRLGLNTTPLQGSGEGVDLLTLGETALILGRLTIDPTGNPDTLDVWINPDLSGGAAALPAPDTTLTLETATFDGGITRVGVQSYSADNQGGIIDSLRLSDEADGFTIVTSDVELLADDPSLLISLANPFPDIPLNTSDAPITADIIITNDGTTNTLTIADTSAISGDDSASYSILTALPLDIAPGTMATLQVQLDPAGEARLSTASLDLISNDSASATTSIPLSSRILGSNGNQLLNSDFEADPASPINWTSSNVTIAEGIAPGSTNSASLSPAGSLSQAVEGEADWFFETFFQAPDTADRAFNLLISAPVGRINLRYQGTSAGADQTWNAFDNTVADDSWGAPLTLPAVQPGATYLLRITGTAWDSGTPTYGIELSSPNSTTIVANLSGLDRFQGAIPSTPPTEVSFSTEFGNSLGFVVDDPRFINGTPPSGPPVITAISYDPSAQSVTLNFEAQIGINYLIFASDDLLSWEQVAEQVATSSSETFTETGVSAPKRFYQISAEQ